MDTIRITPHAVETVTLTSLDFTTISAAIGCRVIEAASCAHNIDLWVDEEGLLVDAPQLNLRATFAAHALGWPGAIFGNAVALGHDDEGETVPLSPEQHELLTRTLEVGPTREIVNAVTSLFDYAPAVVDAAETFIR
ncbi:DUF3846 domain-containing protein [Microbacteriaceae bacterium VKM Ac-2854]|nr:DUF3846 domain-containing protein [Microbacteriaceae bacterium VKM Ac-2854]